MVPPDLTEEELMKILQTTLVLAASAALVSCGEPDSSVEEQADQRAEQLEQQADVAAEKADVLEPAPAAEAYEQKAEQLEERAEEVADIGG